MFLYNYEILKALESNVKATTTFAIHEYNKITYINKPAYNSIDFRP